MCVCVCVYFPISCIIQLSALGLPPNRQSGVATVAGVDQSTIDVYILLPVSSLFTLIASRLFVYIGLRSLDNVCSDRSGRPLWTSRSINEGQRYYDLNQ